MGSNMMREMSPHAAGRVRVLLGCKLDEVRERAVLFTDGSGKKETLPNDVVFAMIGREAPLDFFRRSGIPIRGEWRAATLGRLRSRSSRFCCFVYTWKADTAAQSLLQRAQAVPVQYRGRSARARFGKSAVRRASRSARASTIRSRTALAIVLFGYRAHPRRKTPYVTRQTLTLMAVQVIPLFLLPYLVLPWMGNAGVFDHGILQDRRR